MRFRSLVSTSNRALPSCAEAKGEGDTHVERCLGLPVCKLQRCCQGMLCFEVGDGFDVLVQVHVASAEVPARPALPYPGVFCLLPGVFCSSFITPAWLLLVAISSGVFPCTYSHTSPRCLSHHNNEHTSHNCTFTFYHMILGIHVGPALQQRPSHRLVSVESRLMQWGDLPPLHMQPHATKLPQPLPP